MPYLLPGAVAWALSACSGEAVTAPEGSRPEVAATDAPVSAARAGTGSCVYTPVQGNTGTTYDVVVSWSGLSVARITIYTQLAASFTPILQADLAHPTRKGSLSVNVASLPAHADLIGHGGGLGARVNCVDGGL
jgi:hypothetical protein